MLPKSRPTGAVCPPVPGEPAPAVAPSSPASAGLTGLEPVRFFTGTVGTLRGASRDHVRAGRRHPRPHGAQGPHDSCLSNCTGPGWKQRIPRWGNVPLPAPPPPFLWRFRNPACISIHGPFLSQLPGPVCCFFSSFLLWPRHCHSSFPPLPLGLPSMGKFLGRSGAEGRGRTERERKGARLRQKADGRARQRGETGPLNVHPITKKCLWRVGVWRDPFSWGLNGFSSGLSQSPTQPLTPRERAAPASSLRCRSHPIPAPVPRHLRGRRGAQQNLPPSTGGWGLPRRLPPGSGVTDPGSGGCSPSVPRGGGRVRAVPFSAQAPCGWQAAGLTRRR